jgi:hypothetical protein
MRLHHAPVRMAIILKITSAGEDGEEKQLSVTSAYL